MVNPVSVENPSFNLMLHNGELIEFDFLNIKDIKAKKQLDTADLAHQYHTGALLTY
jgi:hypothetical protein